MLRQHEVHAARGGGCYDGVVSVRAPQETFYSFHEGSSNKKREIISWSEEYLVGNPM